MALTKIKTGGIQDDAVTQPKIAAGSVGTTELASNAVGAGNLQTASVETAKIQDQAVTLAKLPHGTSSNDGKFLRANNGADPSFETVSIPASITINNQADNRVITATGTTDTLNGEADLIYDGASLNFAHGKGARLSYIRPTSQSNTNTGNAAQQYWKIGEIGLNGSEGAVITLMGANGYSGGSSAAGETTIVLRGSNSSTLLGFWYSNTPGGDTATYSDVRWKHISGVNYELWVSAGPYNNIAPIVKTTGTFDNTNAAGTGSNNAPTGSTALPSSYRNKVGSIDTIEYQSTGTIFKKDIYIAANEGIYMDGGSTDANYLDDYEEGDWSPGGSWTTIDARYIKVGRTVYAGFSLRANTTGSADVQITNLPFTAANNKGSQGGIAWGLCEHNSTGGWLQGFVDENTTNCIIKKNNANNLTFGSGSNNMNNQAFIRGTIIYLSAT